MAVTRAGKMTAFKDDADKMGLKKDTVAKLIDSDIDSVDILAMLRESDITSLGLSMGQTIILRQWVQSLQTTASSSQDSAPEESTSGLSALLGDVEEEQHGNQASSGSKGKPLFVIDFITRNTTYSDSFGDNPVCARGDVQLVMRSSRPKLLPEHVSLAQWSGANARIMKTMIRNGSLQTPDEMCEYLDYVETVSDYAQVNTLPSVLLYDHEFRRRQAEKNRPWDCEDFHLANFYLCKKDSVPRDTSGKTRPGGVRQMSVEICRNFNGVGCLRETCRYAHVCAVCRVSGHSRSAHRDNYSLNPNAPSYQPPSRRT